MIVFVASYIPVAKGKGSLGAARKIELIINQLSKVDSDIILLNTADFRRDGLVRPVARELGGIGVREFCLPVFLGGAISKVASIFMAGRIARSLFDEIGIPRLVWLYNGYAFESLFGRAAKKHFECPIVFEFEDWHFARNRGLSPKPFLDWLAWKCLGHHVDISFAVNGNLARRLGEKYGPTHLLPGIVTRSVDRVRGDVAPFSREDDVIRVGYFGQLNTEKGAHIVLELASRLPNGYELHVTGIGPLASNFRDASATEGSPLRFHGAVAVDRLYEIVEECDVILNPHFPLEDDAGGLFPFKVIEAVSSGKVLISTSVPKTGFESILGGVKFIEQDIDSFVRAVVEARQFYQSSRGRIESAAEEAYLRFGDGCVSRLLADAKLI
ncbi:glycosyltransferase family 4 protein [Cupriavidus necator]|uniref:Glycosyltransferase n=1 Tax=Cupriavidus necator TaxID=106590 RepID=A0A367PQJ5_CUPNE|nr:glycosyltransferase [Cupriavidus necator]QQX88679.1 glycosyltransferase family 4 protein [Cupriavidus necator]RCJ09824.1 glycosyltransferase [Cupriavidus necator]